MLLLLPKGRIYLDKKEALFDIQNNTGFSEQYLSLNFLSMAIENNPRVKSKNLSAKDESKKDNLYVV